MSESAPASAPERSIESPPPAAQPVRESIDEPRQALHRLARELVRTRDRRLLVEFLTLRRALR